MGPAGVYVVEFAGSGKIRTHSSRKVTKEDIGLLAIGDDCGDAGLSRIPCGRHLGLHAATPNSRRAAEFEVVHDLGHERRDHPVHQTVELENSSSTKRGVSEP